MVKETEPNQIEEIINALDTNLKNLEDARGMTMGDVKEFLLDLLGTVRDMWERFKGFFEEMDKLKEIEEATEKGEKYTDHSKKINDNDVERLYQ